MNIRARLARLSASAEPPASGVLVVDLRPGSAGTFLEAPDGTRTPWPPGLTPGPGPIVVHLDGDADPT